MNRLPRFEEHRFVGLRDTMRVYDCDDPDQFAILRDRVETEDLVRRLQVQSFGPDTLEEALNRGFKPLSPGAKRGG